MTTESSVQIATAKNEQIARIVLRDTTLYVNLTLVAALFATQPANNSLNHFAMFPVWSLVMVSIYYSNDYYVSALRDYVKHTDKSRASWESKKPRGFGYKLQKELRFLVVLISFFLTPAYFAANHAKPSNSADWFIFSIMILCTAVAGLICLMTRRL